MFVCYNMYCGQSKCEEFDPWQYNNNVNIILTIMCNYITILCSYSSPTLCHNLALQSLDLNYKRQSPSISWDARNSVYSKMNNIINILTSPIQNNVYKIRIVLKDQIIPTGCLCIGRAGYDNINNLMANTGYFYNCDPWRHLTLS